MHRGTAGGCTAAGASVRGWCCSYCCGVGESEGVFKYPTFVCLLCCIYKHTYVHTGTETFAFLRLCWSTNQVGQNAYACEEVLHHALHGRILAAEWKCAQRGITHALHGHIVCSRVTGVLLDTMMYPIMSGVCDCSIAASRHISIGATYVANMTSFYSSNSLFWQQT
jgi:hypothetical protein